jgi:hypothetical protein
MNLAKLQAYATERVLELPVRAADLHRQLRAELIRASDAGDILDSFRDIHSLLKLIPEPPPQLVQQLRARKLHERAFCILGGEKNQARHRGIPHFKRRDGAWFDFSIVVRETDDHLELLAYDYEIRFPPGMGAPFVRYDLNPPFHANTERELRCHVHLGHEDGPCPSLLMTPSEMLSVLLTLGQRSSSRKPRDLTDFEVSWHAETHALVKR